MMLIIRNYGFITVSLLVCLLSAWLVSFAGNSKIQQQNQAPLVKIINTKDSSNLPLGSQLSYEISVADKEDGNSKYDEINAKEVLLEVRYLKDKSKAAALLSKPVQPDAPGLAVIRTSNCFSCHNFNSKAMGPSFYEISKKYTPTKANIDSLVKRISAGSTGIWGKEKMPSHPELSARDIKNTVLWIFKNGADPDDNYFVGLNGVIPARIIKSPGAYVLTASYVDHGLKEAPGKQRLKGQDIAVLYAK
ncbi:MAG TPA: c-type cytochrome [Mucilaginibacter sp.]|jgi:cytochrome c|nr:c-type cytochrome [Mucilaginibacter sp.]